MAVRLVVVLVLLLSAGFVRAGPPLEPIDTSSPATQIAVVPATGQKGS